MNIFTDEDIKEIVGPWGDTPIKGYTRSLFDKIEAKLREKQEVNTLRDAAQQALEALEIAQDDCIHGEMAELSPIFEKAITALRAALAEQQPEPVAQLKAERDALLADAERYQWLRDTLHGAKAGGGLTVNDELQVYEAPIPGEEVRIYWYPDTPVGHYEQLASTLDAAIDAARGK